LWRSVEGASTSKYSTVTNFSSQISSEGGSISGVQYLNYGIRGCDAVLLDS